MARICEGTAREAGSFVVSGTAFFQMGLVDRRGGRDRELARREQRVDDQFHVVSPIAAQVA